MRIYVDTSVIGGCEDDEWSEASLRLVESFLRGDNTLVISDLTIQELAAAPKTVTQHLNRVPERKIEIVRLTDKARELAESYIAKSVISRHMIADAQHIAIATLARVDVLVSWNFKHIVNIHRIHGYNSVNGSEGHPELEIRTPREVLDDA